jgi:sec-independent protein translocase protein TatA
MGFGGLGMWEILLILVVLLLVFGAKRLPELGGSLGKGIREFKRSVKDIEHEIKASDEPKADQIHPPRPQAQAEQPKAEEVETNK